MTADDLALAVVTAAFVVLVLAVVVVLVAPLLTGRGGFVL